MSNKHHIERTDLDHMAEIARVSSYVEGVEVWTELAVYWREHATRPWVGVVEGRTNAADMTDRFKAMAAGTMSRVANWFEGSRLRDQLLSGVEQHLTIDGKVSGTIREEAQRRAAGDTVMEWRAEDASLRLGSIHLERLTSTEVMPGAPIATFSTATPKLRVVGITTDSLREAVTWLYPEDGLTDAALARMVERDFGVAERTVRNALAAERDAKPITGVWVAPFLSCLKCFDRQLWQAGLETITGVEG